MRASSPPNIWMARGGRGGFADPGGPRKRKAPMGRLGSLMSARLRRDGAADDLRGFVLADDGGAQVLFEVDDFAGLPFCQALKGTPIAARSPGRYPPLRRWRAFSSLLISHSARICCSLSRSCFSLSRSLAAFSYSCLPMAFFFGQAGLFDFGFEFADILSWLLMAMRILAPASSSRSMALSGKKRPAM